ncbi:MAG: hypothetical protein ACRD2A_13160, partial [Vicinamibacterales bacterium]
MNVEARFHRLAASFGSVAMELPAGTVYQPPSPISLAEVLGRAVAGSLVRDHLQPLIEFGQEPHSVDSVELGVLPIGRGSGFLCLRGGRGDDIHAVAATMSRSPGILLSTWLAALLARNGADYGVEILRRLPPWIRCRRPELLRQNFVKRAVWKWLEWANRAGVCPWSELRGHVLDRWGRDEWDAVLSHEDRRALLRIYFAVSY